MKRARRYWVYHDNRGFIAGPFTRKESAQKRMEELIRESAGQALWLSVVSST